MTPLIVAAITQDQSGNILGHKGRGQGTPMGNPGLGQPGAVSVGQPAANLVSAATRVAIPDTRPPTRTAPPG